MNTGSVQLPHCSEQRLWAFLIRRSVIFCWGPWTQSCFCCFQVQEFSTGVHSVRQTESLNSELVWKLASQLCHLTSKAPHCAWFGRVSLFIFLSNKGRLLWNCYRLGFNSIKWFILLSISPGPEQFVLGFENE